MPDIFGPQMAAATDRRSTGGIPATPQDQTSIGAKEMTFLEHLEELRWLVFRSACAIAVGMVLAFIYPTFFFDTVLFAPMQPDFVTYKWLCWLGRESGLADMCTTEMNFRIQTTEMSGQFMAHMAVAFTAGLILACPYVLWELWRFVAPGLRAKEKAAARGIVAFIVLLFAIGIVFGYFVLAPLSVQFFGNYQVSKFVETVPRLNDYVSTVTSVTLWTGIVFQMPLIIVFLTRIGIAGPGFLRTYRKHGYVIIFVLAAIITPPDVVSQLLVGLPLILLYEVSIFLSARTQRRMERKRAEEDAPRTSAQPV